jgi:hypothetical protein
MYDNDIHKNMASNITHQLLQGSVLFRLLSSVIDPMTEASSNARAVQSAHTIGAALSNIVICSYLYQWFETEPESHVIVIDLRETWTVASILQLMTTIVAQIQPFCQTAIYRSTVKKYNNIGKYLTNSQIGTLLGMVFTCLTDDNVDND